MTSQHRILVAALAAGTSSMWPEEELQQTLARVQEELARNEAALRGYTWLQHTEIYSTGRLKSQEHYLVMIGPDGEQQRTLASAAPLLSDTQQIKHGVVSRKIQGLKNYMEQAQQLIDKYVPASPVMIEANFSAGDGTLSETSTGMVEVTVRNYVRSGDVATLTFDMTGGTIQSVVANSYLGKDPVDLKVTFASLPDGTRHAAHAFLSAKEKDIEVTSTNSSYQRN